MDSTGLSDNAVQYFPEYALKNNFEPQRTTYFVFGDDEETYGNGAKEIADWFIKNKIEFE